MAEQTTGLANLFGGLSLTGETTELIGSASNCPRSTQQALVEDIRTLIQSCEATLAHAQHIQTLVESTNTPSYQGIVELSSLRRRVTALAGITDTFTDATERSIIAYITSLVGPGTLVQKMLSHFTNELSSITRDVLNSTSDDNNVLRVTLEMCYDNALDASGTLHSDNYFIPLGEANLEWPYDPDFESEDYYEHEDRIAIDDGYAEAFRVRCKHQSEKKRQQREEWIRFWIQALSKCPNGPTLFYSPASHLPHCQFADVPRYLFRAFDYKSSGKSDHYVVASSESISAKSYRSRVDLLSRTAGEVTRMLYSHLTKSCFGGKDTDNLMSWSSSLLFVIQYAIWRCHNSHHGDPAKVEICMVDTRKFPHGQFVRDMSLLRAYREAPEVDEKMRSFFNFRLKSAYFDNGEYLSQGVLHHTGRSSVVSLAQLIQAGLHDLYPQFADPGGMDRWTKRVGSLRSRWSIEQTTTQRDIQKAVEIARACFKSFDACDVALLLLSFKNRKLRVPATKDDLSNKLFEFYFEISMVSTQIASLNRHHRSRGFQADEREVQNVAEELQEILLHLWQRRPSLLRVDRSQLQKKIWPGLRSSVGRLVDLCSAAYFAEVIYLGRAYGKCPTASAESLEAMKQIYHIVDSPSGGHSAVDPGFIWPLFMYAVEHTDPEQSQWAVRTLRKVKNPIWHSEFVSNLAQGISEEQLKQGQRVDTRYFCLKHFNNPPPFI